MSISSVGPGELLEFKHLEIKLRDGQSIDDAIRRFKSLVQKDGIIQEYRDRQRYEKPSDRKRREQRENINRIWLENLREQQIISGEWQKIQDRKEKRKQQKIEERKKRSSELGENRDS